MHILVIGATGPTGRRIVDEALAAGHAVTALVREEGRLEARDGLVEVTGDVREPGTFDRALVGQDAVICALGHVPDSPTHLCSTATGWLVEAMDRAGVARLVLVTAAMVGHPRDRLPLLYRLLEAALPAKDKARLADRREQERRVRASGVAWTLVRAPWLRDGEPLGSVTVGPDLRLGVAASVRRADLARWMVGALGDPAFERAAVAITN